MADASLTPMLTYTGLVDDFAVNHKDACINTLEQLNEHLISAVLVGHPLLINDGHMIMHPAIRQAVVDPEASPLQGLIASGYVKILTRNGGNLELLADQMADEGITSAQRFGAQEDYRKRYAPALHKLMSRLRMGEPQSFLHPWPDLNTTSIFHKVAGAAYQSIRRSLVVAKLREELDALRRFRDAYESGQYHRRTDWENVAQRLKQAGKISERLFQELMFAANEVYQYSWGCALARKDNRVRVETRAPKFTSFDISVGETRSADQESVSFYTPDFAVARRKIGDNWRQLAEVARAGTDTYYAKVTFQRCLDTYYGNDAAGIDKGTVDAAAKKYSKSLSDHFRREERAEIVYDYMTALGGAAVGIPAAALPLWEATGVGLAIGVATIAAGQVGLPRAMMKLVGRGNGRWITASPLGQRPLAVSNFQIDQKLADKYRRGVQEFKPA